MDCDSVGESLYHWLYLRQLVVVINVHVAVQSEEEQPSMGNQYLRLCTLGCTVVACGSLGCMLSVRPGAV